MGFNNFRDEDFRDEAMGLPLLYGTFSSIYSIVFSTIFFRLGWSNASQGMNICQAWREYQQERQKLVDEKLNEQSGFSIPDKSGYSIGTRSVQ